LFGMNRNPDTYIDAQAKLFEHFDQRRIRIQFWSKFLITPKELALLFKRNREHRQFIQEIASSDLGEAGRKARTYLGIT
jgi:hypothetical protein